MKNFKINPQAVQTTFITAFLICLAALTQLSAGSFSSNVAFDTTSLYGQPWENDATFFLNVAEACHEQIRLGKLAQVRGGSEEVRELGKSMQDHNKKFLVEIIALAQSKRINLPAPSRDKESYSYGSLFEKTGEDFDKSYCEVVFSEYKASISGLEAASSESADRDIRAWANATLPLMHNQLNQVIKTQDLPEESVGTSN